MFSCQGGFDSALWKCIYKAVLYSRLDHITQNTHYHRIWLMQLLQRAHTLQHTFLNNIFYDESFVLRHLQCIYLLTPNTVSVNSTFCPTDITNIIVPEWQTGPSGFWELCKTKSSWQTKSVLIPCDAIMRILQSRKPTPGIHWENFTACVLWPVGPDRSAVSCVRNTRAHINTRSLVNSNVKNHISLVGGGF